MPSSPSLLRLSAPRKPAGARSHATPSRGRPLAPLLALLAASCVEGPLPEDAAPRDSGVPSDAIALTDASAPLTWVDIAVSGCRGEPPGPGLCVADAPFHARFTAVAPAILESHLWRFGDGQGASREASPAHVYSLPGVYTVELDVEGPGGTAGIRREGAIVVEPAALGGRCEVAEQCESQTCWCAADPSCPPALAGGRCTAACADSSACGPGALCAELDASGGGAPWQRPLCVVDCGEAESCPAGLACRSLLSTEGDWRRGCFPGGVLGDVGDPCRGGDGLLDPALCASGVCLDRGERGLCGASCSAGSCPLGSACATFADGGENSCVASCDVTPCDGDPAIGCAAPGAAFTVDAVSPAAAGYCSSL